MDRTDQTAIRVRARDAAMRLLNRLTFGAAFAAVAGVGIFGAVSAATIPGTSSTSASSDTATSSTSSTSTSASTSTSSTSSSSSSGLQSSSGVSSSSGGGVAVSGASH